MIDYIPMVSIAAKKIFCVLLGAALQAGCASFASISRDAPAQPPACLGVAGPYSDLAGSWEQFPITGVRDYLEGNENPKAGPVTDKDSIFLEKAARSAFAEKGLLDGKKGSGIITVKLVSLNRWTYGRLARSVFSDTAFLFLLPTSVKTGHKLEVTACRNGLCRNYSGMGTVKTTFQLLLLPLYPFTLPSVKERSVIRRLLENAATQTASCGK
jgi:hypothetical protein